MYRQMPERHRWGRSTRNNAYASEASIGSYPDPIMAARPCDPPGSPVSAANRDPRPIPQGADRERSEQMPPLPLPYPRSHTLAHTARARIKIVIISKYHITLRFIMVF